MDTQTQTNFISIIPTKRRHLNKNFVHLLSKNEYLFKTYLMVKLIKHKSNLLLASTFSPELASLEDKLILKIIHTCRNDEQSQVLDDKSIGDKLLAYLVNEYRLKYNARFYLNGSAKSTPMVQSENELKCLLSKLDHFDKSENKNDSGDGFLTLMIRNLSNVKTALNNMIHSLSETNRMNAADVSSLSQQKEHDEPLFDANCYDKFDRLILNIIDKITNLAKFQYEQSHHSSDIETSFPILVKDFKLLIDLNRAFLNRKFRHIECMHDTCTPTVTASFHSYISEDDSSWSPSKRTLSETRSISVESSSSESSDHIVNEEPVKAKIPCRISSAEKTVKLTPVSAAAETIPIKLKPGAKVATNQDMNEKSVIIEQLSGIGKTYASRLKERSINTLADLVDLYEKTCASNEAKFERELKHAAFMRDDIAKRMTETVKNCLNSRKH